MRQRNGGARGLRALGVVLCLLGGWRPAGAQGLDTSGFAGQVLSLLNQARAANGLPPLHEFAGARCLLPELQRRDEAGYGRRAGLPFPHRTDGSTFEDRINRAGYTGWTSIGENIAAGQPSPQAVVDAWMNSPGHRANILDAGFQDIGIGIAVGPGTWPGGYQDPAVIWWTTDFGSQGVSAGSGAGLPSSPAVPLAPTPSSAGASSPPAASQPGGTPLAGTTNLGGTPAAGGLTPAAGSGAEPLALATAKPRRGLRRPLFRRAVGSPSASRRPGTPRSPSPSSFRMAPLARSSPASRSPRGRAVPSPASWAPSRAPAPSPSPPPKRQVRRRPASSPGCHRLQRRRRDWRLES